MPFSNLPKGAQAILNTPARIVGQTFFRSDDVWPREKGMCEWYHSITPTIVTALGHGRASLRSFAFSRHLCAQSVSRAWPRFWQEGQKHLSSLDQWSQLGGHERASWPQEPFSFISACPWQIGQTSVTSLQDVFCLRGCASCHHPFADGLIL